MTDKLRWFAALLITAAAILAWLPISERTAIEQSETGLKRALGMYAVARGLNAAISVAQGTRISVEPVGVGVEIAAGEALRPVQDLVEQFSAAMLAAAAVFGLQLLLMKLGAHWALCLALTLAGIATIALWRLRGRWANAAVKLFMILLILRFAVPVSASLSNWVHDQVLAPEQVEVERVVLSNEKYGKSDNLIPSDLDGSARAADKAPGSITDILVSIGSRISKYVEDIKRAAGNVKSMVNDMAKDAERLTEAMLKVAVAFLVQTVVLPLLFACSLIALVRAAGRSLLSEGIA